MATPESIAGMGRGKNYRLRWGAGASQFPHGGWSSGLKRGLPLDFGPGFRMGMSASPFCGTILRPWKTAQRAVPGNRFGLRMRNFKRETRAEPWSPAGDGRLPQTRNRDNVGGNREVASACCPGPPGHLPNAGGENGGQRVGGRVFGEGTGIHSGSNRVLGAVTEGLSQCQGRGGPWQDGTKILAVRWKESAKQHESNRLEEDGGIYRFFVKRVFVAWGEKRIPAETSFSKTGVQGGPAPRPLNRTIK